MPRTWSQIQVEVDAATWSLFFVSTIFIGLRILSRIKAGAGLQADDWVLLAGWIFVLIASAIVTLLMSIFLDPTKSELSVAIARLHQNLQSVALGLTKTSFGITLLRLMPGGREVKVIWVVLVTMNLQFAAHMVATWQQVCGNVEHNHIGNKCWSLTSSVTFSVFSALYSALCDFILALLPWKMIFNLQLRQSERISIALALSMGVIAGITGVMKGVQGTKLLEITNPDYLHLQGIYWIWTQAEPNVTIVSASIPVLRGFFRHHMRTRSASAPGGSGAYYKTDDSGSKLYNRTTVTASRLKPKDSDGASDSSILGPGPSHGEPGSEGGITWTTEVSVEYDAQSGVGNGEKRNNVEAYEMDRISAHQSGTAH